MGGFDAKNSATFGLPPASACLWSPELWSLWSWSLVPPLWAQRLEYKIRLGHGFLIGVLVWLA